MAGVVVNWDSKVNRNLKVLLLCFLTLSGCTDLGTNGEGLSALSSEDTVRKAVFLYQFGHNASSQQQSANAYFLSVRTFDSLTALRVDGDPTPSLLRHFIHNMPPVKGVSECTMSAGGVCDKKTGARGLVFQVSGIRWVGNGQAEADGGYFEGGLSASGNTYYLEWVSGEWVVVRDVMHWISQPSTGGEYR